MKDTDFTAGSTVTANFTFPVPSGGTGSITGTDIFAIAQRIHVVDTFTPTGSASWDGSVAAKSDAHSISENNILGRGRGGFLLRPMRTVRAILRRPRRSAMQQYLVSHFSRFSSRVDLNLKRSETRGVEQFRMSREELV